jgi:hypothetical protein
MRKGVAGAAVRPRTAAHFSRKPSVTRQPVVSNAYPCALTLAPRPPAGRPNLPDSYRRQS